MSGITHTKVSAKSDGGDTSLVRPSDWNAQHVIEIDYAKVADGGVALPENADTLLVQGASLVLEPTEIVDVELRATYVSCNTPGYAVYISLYMDYGFGMTGWNLVAWYQAIALEPLNLSVRIDLSETGEAGPYTFAWYGRCDAPDGGAVASAHFGHAWNAYTPGYMRVLKVK